MYPVCWDVFRGEIVHQSCLSEASSVLTLHGLILTLILTVLASIRFFVSHLVFCFSCHAMSCYVTPCHVILT